MLMSSFTNIENYYNDDCIMSRVSALIDSHFLKYKEDKGEPIPEAKGSHIMYVVTKVEEFEKNLRDNNIEFVELPVSEDEYNEMHDVLFGKTQTLLEKVIVRGSNFKIIVRSDEDTNHFLPHVHVEISDGSSASISIDDQRKIFDCSGKAKDKDYKKAIECINMNIQTLREEWNTFSKATYRFVEKDGAFYCK